MKHILLITLSLTIAAPAAACDDAEQFIMAGNECQQFVRKFGPDMWQGEACTSMERYKRAMRHCHKPVTQDQLQRIEWLSKHLKDVGYKL